MYLPLYNNLDFFFLDFNLNKKHFKDFKPIKLMVYILELETSQTTAIKILIDTLSSIVSDVKFTFYPYYMEKNTSEEETELMSEQKTTKQIGGLVMKELNKSGSILVYSKLDADKFDKYKYSYNKKRITIGVNLDNLLIILKCMSNLDKMTWALDDEDINKLIIILENTDKKEKKIFRLNLSDLDEEKIEVDTIEFPYSAYFPSSDFHKYCKDMSLITEKIEIKCTNNKVSFGIKGAEICDADFEISESNGGLSIEVNTDNKNEIVQGIFSLKWLNVFTKCTNLSPQVILYLKNDYPLIIQYSVAALGVVKFVLSQKDTKN
jgi:proliferating cell nuclear antigen